MGCTGTECRFLFTAVHFPLDARLREVEAFSQAGKVFFTVDSVNDREFQGRTAAVKNQY
ncbi:hypothetical protein AXX16_1969 [Serratia rubidaea]|nr:hypothetical protein AXX16_1969 [Serratia rubidaea]